MSKSQQWWSVEPLPLARTVLLICLNGGGYHGSYLVIRQVVSLVNLILQHIYQRFFQRDRRRELKLPII